MSDLNQLEARLASGDHVRLQRREAQDVLQKLRARGGTSEAADRIEAQLIRSDEVELVPGDAAELLEELRASGRRWVFGSDEPREHEPPRAAPPEPEPPPGPERPGWLGRLFGR
ncbi:MAG TPA: hypothetical protein VGP56_06850 [Gaiellaceae bacterium]|jgi:hypothetical protein|nr:hypothetical protein [Gaiellaceae bacterium]